MNNTDIKFQIDPFEMPVKLTENIYTNFFNK